MAYSHTCQYNHFTVGSTGSCGCSDRILFGPKVWDSANFFSYPASCRCFYRCVRPLAYLIPLGTKGWTVPLMDVMRKTRQTTYLFIALALVFYAFHLLPQSMLGFILGQTIGLVNARILAYRLQRIGGTQDKNESNRRGIGTGIRLTFVAIGVLLVLRLNEVFDMLGFVIGLSLMPFIVLVWGIWHAKKTQSS